MKTKPGANNPMQKGKRRQKLHEDQNNIGDPQVNEKQSSVQNYKQDKME